MSYYGSNGNSGYNGRPTNGGSGPTGNPTMTFLHQRQMLQSNLSRLIQLLTGQYAPHENQVLNDVSDILASVSELSDTAHSMLATATSPELQRAGEVWCFYDEFPRPGNVPATEFAWACDYTISSLVLLRRYVTNNMPITGITRNIQMQIGLWEMRAEWPQVLPEQDANLQVRIAGLHREPSYGFR